MIKLPKPKNEETKQKTSLDIVFPLKYHLNSVFSSLPTLLIKPLNLLYWCPNYPPTYHNRVFAPPPYWNHFCRIINYLLFARFSDIFRLICLHLTLNTLLFSKPRMANHSLLPIFNIAHEFRLVFTFFNNLKNQKKGFFDIQKLYEIRTSVSINKNVIRT